MTAQPVGATLRHKLRLDHRLRSLRSLGWPTLSGILLALAGILLMAASHRLQVKQNDLQMRRSKADQSIPKPASVHVRAIPALLPNSMEYNSDLAQIFDVAKSQGIVLVSGDYRDADRIGIPVDIRVVDLRINESYTKLKEFLATILNTLPHSAVQELRIERKDSVAVRHQVLLKLALVYASESGSPKPQPLSAQQLLESPSREGKEGLQP